jgi:hypothetical protein
LKISFVFVLVEKAFIFPISLSAWSHNTRLSWACVSKPASKAQPDLRSIHGLRLQIFFPAWTGALDLSRPGFKLSFLGSFHSNGELD